MIIYIASYLVNMALYLASLFFCAIVASIGWAVGTRIARSWLTRS
jgi:hypothetical protein